MSREKVTEEFIIVSESLVSATPTIFPFFILFLRLFQFLQSFLPLWPLSL